MIGKAGALAAEIGGAVAQHHSLLAEAQMREQIFDVGDLLERAEHHDDVGLRRGVGREVAAGDVADVAAVAGDAVARLIAATIGQRAFKRWRGAEIEHARAGGNELGGEFRPGSVSGSP